MKGIICKSGLRGWRAKLQSNYRNFQEFKTYAETFGLHTRLGYKTPENAWRANPLIEGSIDPTDYRKVRRATGGRK